MSEKSVRPSTVDGIKSLAQSLKREVAVRHAEALDLVAQERGMEGDRYPAEVRAFCRDIEEASDRR